MMDFSMQANIKNMKHPLLHWSKDGVTYKDIFYTLAENPTGNYITISDGNKEVGTIFYPSWNANTLIDLLEYYLRHVRLTKGVAKIVDNLHKYNEQQIAEDILKKLNSVQPSFIKLKKDMTEDDIQFLDNETFEYKNKTYNVYYSEDKGTYRILYANTFIGEFPHYKWDGKIIKDIIDKFDKSQYRMEPEPMKPLPTHGEIKANTFGSLRDSQLGKGRYDLVSPFGEKRLAAHYEKGAIKYNERNYELGQSVTRCLCSIKRHINQFQTGDTSEDHLAAAVWNLYCIMHMEEMVKLGKLPKELLDLPNYLADDYDPKNWIKTTEKK